MNITFYYNLYFISSSNAYLERYPPNSSCKFKMHFVVALWRSLTDYIAQIQEEHGVLRTNIMKYRL